MKVTTEIAQTHLKSSKKQTLLAALGVTVGIGIFIFMISLVVGFNRNSDEGFFKTTPHIRIFQEDKLSEPLLESVDSGFTPIIVNPTISNLSLTLLNPSKIISDLKNEEDVVAVTEQVSVSLFYNNGHSQITGQASGANILEANAMFDIESTMLAGNIRTLVTTPNGIIIGVGIADKFNVQLNDNINVISAIGVSKILKVVGVFSTSNATVDDSKSYVNLSMAQQLLKQNHSYVTDIYVNIKDPNKAIDFTEHLAQVTGYAAEDWQTANEAAMASKKTRRVMFGAIALAILLVAAFGIYNIINMTVKEKLNDIAILKAIGFSGKDVLSIFLKETFIIGLIGTSLGLVLAYGLIQFVSGIYIGGNIGYFPIGLEPEVFIMGVLIGMFITLMAGYIPARNAAKIDPIEIFRK